MQGEKLAYGAREAATKLGISMPTFYALASRTGFPAIRVGKKILVPAKELSEWLTKQSGKQEA